jgi:hypothetical protein
LQVPSPHGKEVNVVLPFHVLALLETNLTKVLSTLTHKELEVFWSKCDLPKEVLGPYYGPFPPAPPGYYYPKPSKRKIIGGVLGQLDRRGLLGGLIRILDATIAYGKVSPEVEIREAVAHLEDLRRRIQTREIGVRETNGASAETKVSEGERQRGETLDNLRQRFLELLQEPNHQKRGYLFQDFLSDLFELNSLRPRKSFTVVGEQIDGAFELDGHHFLVEARWRKDPANASDTYVLKGKVDGRPGAITLGLFVSLNGFAPDTVEALARGKELNVILTDGEVLYGVLEGRWSLPDAIRAMVREISQKANPYLRARDVAV